MSALLTLYTVAEPDIQAIVDEPLKLDILHYEELRDPSQLDDLAPEKRQDILDWKPQATPQRFHLEGAFQSMHYLLTGESEWNTGAFPLNFITGQRLAIGEIGWGKANFYNASDVKEIATALNALDLNQVVEERYNPDVFKERQINPARYNWKKEDGASLVKTLTQLRDFVNKTADQSLGFYIVME